MFNLAKVYEDYDNAQTAKLRNEIYGNQLAEAQRAAAQAEQDRQKQEADEAALRSARTGAWNGNSAALGQLASMDPREAAAIADFRDARIKAGRAAEVEKAAADAKELGQSMAWIKASPDPDEAAARWDYVRENSATGTHLPKQFDPRMVDMLISRSMDMGQILDQGRSDKAQAAMASAFAPQRTDPRGEQGAIQPSANPAGLDPRIIGAVDSQSPLGPTLAGSESGGSFTARNSVEGSGGTGHFGRGQFSRGRLDDAKRAGVIPGDMTPEQFMASPEAQQRVEQWHVDDIRQGIRNRGLDRFEGQTLNGVPITEQGMINVAHLGGQGGLAQFLESGGKYNPADKNGTKLSDYLAMGARDAAQSAGDPMSNPRVAQLMQIAGDPNLTDAQKGLVGDLLKSFQPAEAPKIGDQYRNVGDTLVDLAAPGGPQAVNIGAQAGGGGGASSKFAMDLRKEIANQKPWQDYQAQGSAMGQIWASAQNPSAAGDISMIFAYMKMLDPNSVVREGEFATAQNAAGIPTQIVNAYNRAMNGERLSDDQRKDFVGRAQSLYDQTGRQIKPLLDQYSRIAQANGLDPKDIIPDYGYSPQPGQPPAQQGNQQDAQSAQPVNQPQQILNPDDYRAIPSGTQYIDPNGVLRTKR